MATEDTGALGNMFLGFTKVTVIGAVTVASLYYMAKFFKHKAEMKRQEALMAQVEIQSKQHQGIAPTDQELMTYQKKISEYRHVNAEEQSYRRQLAAKIAEQYQQKQKNNLFANQGNSIGTGNRIITTTNLERSNDGISDQLVDSKASPNKSVQYRPAYQSQTARTSNKASRSPARSTSRAPASSSSYSDSTAIDLPPTRTMGAVN